MLDLTTRTLRASDQLRRIGWILIGVGLLCAFSLVFLPSGVIAAGLGLLCLIAARITRRAPAIGTRTVVPLETQPRA